MSSKNVFYDPVDTSVDKLEISNSCRSSDASIWKRKRCKVLVGIVALGILVAGIVAVHLITRSEDKKGNEVNKGGNGTARGINQNCVYYLYTRNVTDERLESFGGRCELGSSFVNDTCGVSGVLCDKCNNGMLLPRYCFCDKTVNCEYDKPKSSPADHPRKNNCSSCYNIFMKSIYKNRTDNIPECDSIVSRSPVDSPTCKDGYFGVMCNVITKRVCEVKEGQIDGQVKSCENEGSDDETCILKRKNILYLCQSFQDSNMGIRKKQTSCSIR